MRRGRGVGGRLLPQHRPNQVRTTSPRRGSFRRREIDLPVVKLPQPIQALLRRDVPPPDPPCATGARPRRPWKLFPRRRTPTRAGLAVPIRTRCGPINGRDQGGETMLKRAIVLATALFVLSATAAVAASPHFKKGGEPVCTISGSGTNSTSTTCTASLAGLGGGDVTINT